MTQNIILMNKSIVERPKCHFGRSNVIKTACLKDREGQKKAKSS